MIVGPRNRAQNALRGNTLELADNSLLSQPVEHADVELAVQQVSAVALATVVLTAAAPSPGASTQPRSHLAHL